METTSKCLYEVNLFHVRRIGGRFEAGSIHTVLYYKTIEEARQEYENHKEKITKMIMNKDFTEGVSLEVWQWNNKDDDYSQLIEYESYYTENGIHLNEVYNSQS